MKQFVKVISWILVVALIAGAIAFIYIFTNGGSEDLKTFTLSCDGKLILSTESSMNFEANSEYCFDVDYIFDLPNSESHDYNVRVVPNPDADFTFSVDDVTYSWRGEGDLTQLFVREKDSNGFTLSIVPDFSIGMVLRTLHDRRDLRIGAQIGESAYPFTLVVFSYDEKVTYYIYFNVVGTYELDWKIMPSGFSEEVINNASQYIEVDNLPSYAKSGTKVTSCVCVSGAGEIKGYFINSVIVVGVTSNVVYHSTYDRTTGELEFIMPNEAIYIVLDLYYAFGD